MSFNKRMLSAGAAPFVNEENFRAVTWTGNGATHREITGVGFKPDIIWYKTRTQSYDHNLTDSTRGSGKQIRPDRDISEVSAADHILSFDDDGFTIGSGGDTNKDGDSYIAWCWKVGGGTTSSNSDGSGITSTVQSNADAGISIVKWTGTGNASHTVGHGLGTTPDVIIGKDYSNTRNWIVYWGSAPSANVPYGLTLDIDAAANTTSGTNGSFGTPTSSVLSFTNGSGSINNINASSANIVAYCFSAVSGFSNFGTYIGNGSAEGPIVETGFEPAFVMVKGSSNSGSWLIFDNKRNTINPRNKALRADSSAAETTSSSIEIDFLSKGFQLTGTDTDYNGSERTYVYMAFAANPDEEVPTLASSFNAETYYGTGASGNSVSGIGFQPNFLWTKSIAGSTNDFSHALMNSIRGASQSMNSNNNNTEATNANGLESFDSDGFTVGSGAGGWNYDGTTYAAWAWKANDDEPIIKGGPAKAIYKFENNTNDVTGNHNATASSLSGYTSSGKFNKAAQFNGSDTYITLPNGSFRYNELTISVWVKPSGSGHRTILENYEYSGGSQGFIFRIDNSTNKARFVIYNGDCDNPYPDDTSCSNVTAAVSTSAIATNAYTHIVVTMKLGELKMYINGELDVTTITQAIGYISSAPTNIGVANHAYASGGESYYQGEIDQLRIYDGVASQLDVDALYAETASNNDDLTLGEPNSTIISANVNAGFSISKKTFAAEGTIQHGLSSTPEMVILKATSSAEDWQVYHSANGTGKYLKLNTSAGVATRADSFSSVNATSVTNSWTGAEQTWIMYSFHSVTGYSKFGSYTGNGSSTGPSVTTGFKPDFILIKRNDATEDWKLIDSLRGFANTIEPNEDIGEEAGNNSNFTFSSTGFQIGDTHGDFNASGGTYIYWAVAKNVPSNTTLADSFGITEYVGTASSRDISGFSFRPDLIWIKSKSGTTFHNFANSLSGPSYIQYSNSNSAGERNDGIVSYFNSDGARIGSDNSSNQNNQRFIAWAWKAGNTWQSNIDGTQESLVNVNTANGFSIVKWKTNGSSSQTVGHGLSSTPELIIFKRLDSAQDWFVETNAIDGSYDYGNLNNNNALTTNEAGAWSTRATSTTITNFTSSNNFEYIAYCWHSVTGYSDIGVYTGNGNSTGPTITTGFQPDFILIKRVEGAASWAMVDSLRGGGQELYANLTDADNAYAAVDFLSNGFQITNTANGYNANTEKYLYMAFKQNATLNTTKENSFNIQTYTGTGSERTVENFGFKPDLVWTKRRSHSGNHGWFDSVRGPGKELATNDSGADQTSSGTIISFDSDGFTAGSNWALNNTNYTYVAWAWKAGNAWVNNHDGAVESIVNYNTGNKFSIVQWEGTGSATTVGHGMGTAPTFIIAKTLESSAKWRVYHSALGGTKYLNLNDIYAEGTSANVWNDTTPTTSLFGVGSDLSPSGEKVIAYCWADVTGYSKFGSYSGNGTTQTISTGFQPDFVMIRANTGSTSYTSWIIFDSVRYGSSSNTNPIYANLSAAEGTRGNGSGDGDVLEISFTSTGFKIGDSGSNNASDEMNDSSKNYIYVAFKIN